MVDFKRFVSLITFECCCWNKLLSTKTTCWIAYDTLSWMMISFSFYKYISVYIYIYIYSYFLFHISDEVPYSQSATKRYDWTDRKRTFQRTTTLQTNTFHHATTPHHTIKRCCHIAVARSKMRIVPTSVSNPVITRFYDAAAILLQRHYSISQWLSRSFFKLMMIVTEEVVLIQTMALLQLCLIFGKIPKYFDKSVWFFFFFQF